MYHAQHKILITLNKNSCFKQKSHYYFIFRKFYDFNQINSTEKKQLNRRFTLSCGAFVIVVVTLLMICKLNPKMFSLHDNGFLIKSGSLPN